MSVSLTNKQYILHVSVPGHTMCRHVVTVQAVTHVTVDHKKSMGNPKNLNLA